MKSGGAFFACKINLSNHLTVAQRRNVGRSFERPKNGCDERLSVVEPSWGRMLYQSGWFPQGQGWRLSGYPLKLSCGVNDWEYSNSGSDIQPTLAGSNI